MEAWIVDAIGTAAPENRFEVLAEQMGMVCARVGYMRQHAFLAAGYYKDELGAYQPEIVNIKNLTPFPHTFDVTHDRLPADATHLLGDAGAEIEPSVRGKLIETLEGLPGDESPLSIYAPLAQVLWETHRRNHSVGSTATITSFPITALPLTEGTTMWLGPPSEAQFLEEEISLTIEVMDEGARVTGESYYPARIGAGPLAWGGRAVAGTTEPLEPADRMRGEDEP